VKHFKVTKGYIPDLLDNKTFIIICVFGFLFGWFLLGPFFYKLAHASWPDCNPSDNNFKILSGVTIDASGTSTYIIDLADHCIKTGDFSIQFSGTTCGWEDPATGRSIKLTGATVFAGYRMSNYIGPPSGASVFKGLNPHDSGITITLESLSIVSDMAVDTGNTDYVYDFFPEPCRYLIIDISAGATRIVTDVWLNMY